MALAAMSCSSLSNLTISFFSLLVWTSLCCWNDSRLEATSSFCFCSGSRLKLLLCCSWLSQKLLCCSCWMGLKLLHCCSWLELLCRWLGACSGMSSTRRSATSSSGESIGIEIWKETKPVVYFDEHLGAAHSKCWLIFPFSVFLYIFERIWCKNEEKWAINEHFLAHSQTPI